MELYRKYRPDSFDDVKGQREAVGIIKGWIKNNNVPHSITLEGPSGCSKTTLARILANELGATSEFEYTEKNVSESRGVDMVTSILEDVDNNITGKNRVWVLDEAHGITKQAQNSLLKIFEEAKPKVYFILCTTDPQKLLPTLLNRCSRIKIKPLSEKALADVINRVLKLENKEIPDEVLNALVSYADGSARKALVKLEQCLSATRPESMLSIIKEEEIFEATIKDLCEIFMYRKPASWHETSKILDSIEGDSETIRRAVLGWVSSALSKGWARGVSNNLLAAILRVFQTTTYDNGKPQLVLMAYDAWYLMNGKQKEN